MPKAGTVLWLFQGKKAETLPQGNRGDQLFKTCQSCRSRQCSDRTCGCSRSRVETGSHRVNPVACTSAGGTVHARCLACIERRREVYAAHARAAAIYQNAEQDARLLTTERDSTVSTREKGLLQVQNMRQHWQLADVKMQHCRPHLPACQPHQRQSVAVTDSHETNHQCNLTISTAHHPSPLTPHKISPTPLHLLRHLHPQHSSPPHNTLCNARHARAQDHSARTPNSLGTNDKRAIHKGSSRVTLF
jgi:hypothetical protein